MSRMQMIMGLAALCLAGGCSSSIVGNWKVDPVPPGDPFYIRQVQFKDDGSYIASARRGKEDLSLEGKYTFDGLHLDLHSPGKPDRRYNARIWMGRKLDLTQNGRKQSLKKQ